ncbi:MAG TPA: hypothetical protein VMS65_13035, partial [Polyangiaceae bacterium]|nr:hypothetical protein [Polyangiaceae bacterium]
MTTSFFRVTAASEKPAPRPDREPWSFAGEGARGRTGVVLVHGFTGSPVSLRPLGELLARRGFAVELPLL